MRLTKANVLSMSTSENVRTGVLLYINDSIILQNRVQITSIDAQKRFNLKDIRPLAGLRKVNEVKTAHR